MGVIFPRRHGDTSVLGSVLDIPSNYRSVNLRSTFKLCPPLPDYALESDAIMTFKRHLD